MGDAGRLHSVKAAFAEQAANQSLRSALQAAAAVLERVGSQTPWLDAQLLAAHALGVRFDRLICDLDEYVRLPQTFEQALERRARREPIAYIIGRKEFYSLEFEVSAAVLVPRPETETLVEAALGELGSGIRRVLEIGTGSSAVAVAMAVNRPTAALLATDISEAALEVARRNAVTHGVDNRVEFRLGDLWQALDDRDGRFDLIVSNPPYVADDLLNGLAPEVKLYEPRLALAGGSDGLVFYRRIAEQASRWLMPGGRLLVEVGDGQASEVAKIFAEAGLSPLDTVRDLGGIERVARAGRTSDGG